MNDALAHSLTHSSILSRRNANAMTYAAVEDIIRRCKKLLPESYTAGMERRIVGHWVGLRPFREGTVSVEARRLADGRVVVNNYGHGGSGFTLCWGCADEVVRLAAQA